MNKKGLALIISFILILTTTSAISQENNIEQNYYLGNPEILDYICPNEDTTTNGKVKLQINGTNDYPPLLTYLVSWGDGTQHHYKDMPLGWVTITHQYYESGDYTIWFEGINAEGETTDRKFCAVRINNTKTSRELDPPPQGNLTVVAGALAIKGFFFAIVHFVAKAFLVVLRGLYPFCI